MIVLLAPEADDLSGMSDVFEPVLVQAFVTQLTIEAFNVAVLHGLAGVYEYVIDLLGIRPLIHRVAGELRTVVTEDFLRHPVKQDSFVQKASDLLAADRSVYFQSQTFPCNLIDQGEYPEALSRAGGIADKVHGPAVIRSLQTASIRHAPFLICAAFCLALQGQSRFFIQTVGLLVVDVGAFPDQHHVDPAIAETFPPGCQDLHSLLDHLII